MIFLLLNTVSVFCVSSRKMAMDEWTLWPLCPCKGPIHPTFPKKPPNIANWYYKFQGQFYLITSVHYSHIDKVVVIRLIVAISLVPNSKNQYATIRECERTSELGMAEKRWLTQALTSKLPLEDKMAAYHIFILDTSFHRNKDLFSI